MFWCLKTKDLDAQDRRKYSGKLGKETGKEEEREEKGTRWASPGA